MDAALGWRIEHACLNAWPSLRQVFLDDWLLRFAGGVSRRANSANPLHAQPRDSEALVDACERLFAAQRLDPLFRIVSIAGDGITRRLERRGYVPEGGTETLYAPIADLSEAGAGAVVATAQPDAAWLAAMTRLKRRTAEEHAAYAGVVDAIALPACFAAAPVEGQLVSLAYGVLHEGVLCVESVVTDERHRGRGLAGQTLAALAEWARCRGATGACLQVATDNAPALALYRRSGFGTCVYTYRYWRGPRRH